MDCGHSEDPTLYNTELHISPQRRRRLAVLYVQVCTVIIYMSLAVSSFFSFFARLLCGDLQEILRWRSGPGRKRDSRKSERSLRRSYSNGTGSIRCDTENAATTVLERTCRYLAALHVARAELFSAFCLKTVQHHRSSNTVSLIPQTCTFKNSVSPK